jgi:ferric-dicitrate binding protein FerR (iron transport regulator)
MSTSDARTASPNPLTPGGFLADEAALKRVFDANFAQAMASAKQQLGEASALAPRVIETAFVNVWGQRATLGNEDHFKSVLSDEIRHGAARALSRRHSGARFGAVGGAHAKAHDTSANETPEHVWEQINRALHGSGTTAEARKAAGDASRHEAAAHMKAVSKRPGWLIPVIIGVVALVVSVAGVLYVDRLGEDDAVLGLVANTAIQPIASSSGQIGSVKLGDGSQMRMGPDTKIFIPDGFATSNRAIKVIGTAEFTVAKKGEKELPFRVVANRNHIIATGTKFVVSTFTADSNPAVFVQEGSVTVKTKAATTVVNAGQAVVVDKGAVRPATDDEKAELFNWVDGRVTVRNKQLRQVVDAMTRWFNYDVKVPDLPLLDRPAAIDVPLDSSRLAISQVEKSANVKFAYEGESKVFRDASGKAPTPVKKK